MDIEKVELFDSNEYTEFVRAFATLLDKELVKWEKIAEDKDNCYRLAEIMPALISLVNTAGYLRGQDNIFLDFRPHTDAQREFYSYENMFEERLARLINFVMDSEAKDFYLERLESYCVKARTHQEATV